MSAPSIVGGLEWHGVVTLMSPGLLVLAGVVCAMIAGGGRWWIRLILIPAIVLQSFTLAAAPETSDYRGPLVSYFLPGYATAVGGLLVMLAAWWFGFQRSSDAQTPRIYQLRGLGLTGLLWALISPMALWILPVLVSVRCCPLLSQQRNHPLGRWSALVLAIGTLLLLVLSGGPVGNWSLALSAVLLAFWISIHAVLQRGVARVGYGLMAVIVLAALVEGFTYGTVQL